ncbi:uncharacterized protein MONBRDRAFT_32264 [Monosiga brevicollis MX1]|uniref:monodehydroascorbate reductase (NADH) n=1 Tax=Monosiga brevicollis TaxID=81824 RepID=A9UYF5_MONBE|nr:uncharacterized protein MONBRDRAFT_32264 [Monosiga brevicollis MX1]EDQ89596.1 predicted protein [Monosiga brevicollis MX1]|eukprot:XP_001745625.1 hypothetical protein [Monosiga brevicollis MX1]
MSSATHYANIVLGGGTAAGYVARAFAQAGATNASNLAIVSREAVLPYERPALSKGFLNKTQPARLPGFHTSVGDGGDRQDAEWYKTHNIDFLGKSNVTQVDVQDRALTLEGGQRLTYDKLIVATGADPIRPNLGDRPGDIHYFRSIVDAENLVETMKKFEGRSARAIVIGGGYIGTEVGAQLLNNGIKVSFVFPEDRLMARIFTPRLANMYRETFESKGAELVHGMANKVVYGDNNEIRGLELKDGTVVSGDLIVAGIGARPVVELFKDQLDMEAGGLKVSEHLQTSDPNIYAIGDVAAYPLKLEGGKYQRQEHVVNARRSAEHVVAELTGQSKGGYDYLPYFYSRIFDFNWKLYGINEGDVVHFGHFEEGKQYGAIWIRDGQVVGILAEKPTDEQVSRMQEVARSRPAAKGEDNVRSFVQGIFGSDIPVHFD